MRHYRFSLSCGALAAALLGVGVAQAQPWIVDQAQENGPVFMAAFSQTDLAQSFMQTAGDINGADVKLQDVGSGGDITISLYDALPNQGGNLLTKGTDFGALPGEWAEVRWADIAIPPETTLFLVFTSSDNTMGLTGDVTNPYPRGQVYANAGYQSFPNFDYTFRTFHIPEPATFGLLGVGALVLLRRRG